MGVLKFYNVYVFKIEDNCYYLEYYEDCVVMNVLFLVVGDEKVVYDLVDDMLVNCF